MLRLSETILNQPVLSLRTGAAIGTTTGTIINPNNLKIEGFYCLDNATHKHLALLYQDIRDIIPQGIVVNDHDVLVDPKELIRLKKIIELKFELLGKPVTTLSKQSLGKVTDFATDTDAMQIQKLYVEKSLLKSLGGGSLSIDRNQIVEITNTKVIVQDLLQPTKATMPATAPAA